MQPDALVVPRSDLVGRKLTATPLLVVEILSPSTRLIDLNLKKARYERAGVATYWVVDPGPPPQLTAWERRGGEFVDVANVGRDGEWTATLPFPVTVRPGSFAD